MEIESRHQHELHENYIYIICATFRPNSATFVYLLEEKIMGLINTDEEELDIFIATHGNYRYIVFGLPKEYIIYAQEICEKLNLRLKQGRPISNEHGPFNLNYCDSYVMTLENINNDNYSIEELNEKIKEELFILHGMCGGL